MQTQLLNYQFMIKSFGKILSALPVTLNIAIVTMIFSLILSFFVALARINKIKVVSKLATVYVSFIRGTPLLVQIYLSYYGIPKVLNHMNARFGWALNVNNVPIIVFVYVAFILNMSAYMSETFRAAILSVEKGQMEAAISVGMTKWQAMKRIVLPQAFVIALPNFGNSFIGLIKDTSLAFVVSIVELMGKAKIVGAQGLNFFEVYIVVALIYWGVCIIVEKLLAILEKKVRIGG
jgi:amino ABC transporter, permease protein, 3-TM region, his/glu/gln/arg/opine family